MSGLPVFSATRIDGSIAPTAAATTTTIATTPAATTTTAVATTAAAATTTAPGLARLGLVHGQPPSVVFLIVQALDRRLRLGLRVHLDKAEALATAGVTVGDHLGVCTVPYWANQLSRSVEFTE